MKLCQKKILQIIWHTACKNLHFKYCLYASKHPINTHDPIFTSSHNICLSCNFFLIALTSQLEALSPNVLHFVDVHHDSAAIKNHILSCTMMTMRLLINTWWPSLDARGFDDWRARQISTISINFLLINVDHHPSQQTFVPVLPRFNV